MASRPASSRIARSQIDLDRAACRATTISSVVPCLRNCADAVEALVLEIGVAHRQRLVDDQHVRATGGGDAEGQAHLHAAGIHAHRLVDVVADLGERFDLGHQRVDFVHAYSPSSWPAMIDVLAAGEIGMEAHAQFQQGGHPAADVHRCRSVGCVVPVIIFSSVLLPAPLMPMMPTASPGVDREARRPAAPT